MARLLPAVGALRRGVGRTVICGLVALLSSCATHVPRQQHDLCSVLDQEPDWYDSAQAAEQKWKIPAPVLMAFVRQESSFRADARPPMRWFLFIPIGRASSAYGYGQIQDPAWSDYKKANGGWFRSRTDMDDVLDFIGWYNDISVRRLGIAATNAEHLYLAYHEGHSGYRSGAWRRKAWLRKVARKVAASARAYTDQLHRCESRFRCRRWYQFQPLCR